MNLLKFFIGCLFSLSVYAIEPDEPIQDEKTLLSFHFFSHLPIDLKKEILYLAHEEMSRIVLILNSYKNLSYKTKEFLPLRCVCKEWRTLFDIMWDAKTQPFSIEQELTGSCILSKKYLDQRIHYRRHLLTPKTDVIRWQHARSNIKVLFIDDWNDQNMQPLLEFFQMNYPSLLELNFIDGLFYTPCRGFTNQWSRENFQQLTASVRNFSQLQSLVISFKEEKEKEYEIHSLIAALPHLKKFILENFKMDLTERMNLLETLPQLQSLHILRFVNIFFDEKDFQKLAEILPQLPSLKSFVFKNYYIVHKCHLTNATAERLALVLHPQNLPHLKEIVFVISQYAAHEDESYMNQQQIIIDQAIEKNFPKPYEYAHLAEG